MLFSVAYDSPRFQVFTSLNRELLYFIENSIPDGIFCRELFSVGAIGKACWDNARAHNPRANSDLTQDKFAVLYAELQKMDVAERRQLYEVCNNNQDLALFFAQPQRDLLDFLPATCLNALKNLASHLYCATKDLQPIIDACAGVNINAHFHSFRDVNGNVCKACGMSLLSPIRANIPEEQQWRADYDHQLCKSKYPIFAVHPDNLIPLCDICNQDAKKSKDLFVCQAGNARSSFHPYVDSANQYVDIQIDFLKDPEPRITVVCSTEDADIVRNLETWDDIYEIKNLVEGRFRNLEEVILNEINPIDYGHMRAQVADKARPLQEQTLKTKEWAFWYHKLFICLNQLDLSPFWAKSDFAADQGAEGGNYILEGN